MAPGSTNSNRLLANQYFAPPTKINAQHFLFFYFSSHRVIFETRVCTISRARCPRQVGSAGLDAWCGPGLAGLVACRAGWACWVGCPPAHPAHSRLQQRDSTLLSRCDSLANESQRVSLETRWPTSHNESRWRLVGQRVSLETRWPPWTPSPATHPFCRFPPGPREPKNAGTFSILGVGPTSPNETRWRLVTSPNESRWRLVGQRVATRLVGTRNESPTSLVATCWPTSRNETR
eukprot:gene7691-biopygen7573